MNDRLNELRGGAGGYQRMDDLESGAPSKTETKPNTQFLDPFFSDVEVVKRNIAEVSEATTRIRGLSDRSKVASTSEDSEAITEELSHVIADANQHVKATKALLERMAPMPSNLSEGQQRIRTNLLNTLTRKFVDVAKLYQAAQQDYKREIKDKVRRQMRVIKPDATEEEVDLVMRNGGDSSQVIKAAIMKGTQAADPIRSAYAHVDSKYQDVLVLEASVKELSDMFLHFALLTERQGELLDSIEIQVQNTMEAVTEGNEQLITAIDLSKSIRKKQACLIVIVLVVIGVIVAIIFATGNNKK